MSALDTWRSPGAGRVRSSLWQGQLALAHLLAQLQPLLDGQLTAGVYVSAVHAPCQMQDRAGLMLLWPDEELGHLTGWQRVRPEDVGPVALSIRSQGRGDYTGGAPSRLPTRRMRSNMITVTVSLFLR